MSDKFKLTIEDHNRIKSMQRHSQISKYLSHRDEIKFEVGDILIKMKRRGSRDDNDPKWEPEVVSSRSQVPKKYYYAFEDDLGIGYVKQIKSDGNGLCDNVICIADTDFYWNKFQVDPDFVDHTLLIGDEQVFSPSEDFKEARTERNKIHAKNRKIAIRVDSEASAFAFLDKLQLGQVFWMGWDLYNATEKECTVTSSIKEPTVNGVWNSKSILPEKITVHLDYVSKYGKHTSVICSNNINGNVFYLTRPYMYDDKKTI